MVLNIVRSENNLTMGEILPALVSSNLISCVERTMNLKRVPDCKDKLFFLD